MGVPHGAASIATGHRRPDFTPRTGAHAAWAERRGYNRPPMLKSLVRTLRGPSRDPRMANISRPLPRGLLDEQVLAALDQALAENPDPAYLVETLPGPLRQVTGHDYQVLDRTTADVTGAFIKRQVMIRDGQVGLWPGYAARAYPLLAQDAHADETRAAIAGSAPGGAAPEHKAGWEPPPPVPRAAPSPVERAAEEDD